MWIFFAIGAAFSQNLRFMLQKHLASTGLSAAGATFSRFVWSAPMVLVAVFVALQVTGQHMPTLGAGFFGYAMLGGVSQILATVAVVKLFKHRNFAVASTFSKTESLQAAVLGVLLLGDFIPILGWFALMVGVIGVLILSAHPIAKGVSVFNAGAGLGLLAGFLFGVSGVSYRAATFNIGADSFVLRAFVTLGFVVCFQTLIMSLYLRYREPDEMLKVFKAWRITFLVGLFGMIGSMFWFLAFTLQNAAYVKTVGQIELVFAALASYFFFNERISWREVMGIGLITLSIFLLIATL